MSELISKSELIKDIRGRPYIDNALVEIFETIVDEQPTVSDQEIRDKVIDEFAEKIVISSNRLNISTDDFEQFGDNVANIIYEIAEQVKEENNG